MDLFRLDFFYFIGVLSTIAIVVYVFYKIFLGKKRLVKVGVNIAAGSRLTKSIKIIIEEIKSGTLKEETLIEFGVHIFWRFTRIGIFALFFAALPIILLWRQNHLIEGQNDLFQEQNKRIDVQILLDSIQTELFRTQNLKIDIQSNYIGEQTMLLANQNKLFEDQNSKLDLQSTYILDQINLLNTQNNLLDTQNYKINLQNNLSEANRRGSLILLMSNILNQIDYEINRQIEVVNDRSNSNYTLSKPLIGRIATLSQGFFPYKYLENDDLIKKENSPERGQLFLTLINSNLSGETLEEIFRLSNFQFANLSKANLSWKQLSYGEKKNVLDLDNASFNNGKLDGANLSNSRIGYSSFLGAGLNYANLVNCYSHSSDYSNANLIFADMSQGHFANSVFRGTVFSGAKLLETNLSNCDLTGSRFCHYPTRQTKPGNAVPSHLLPALPPVGCNMYKSDLSFSKLDTADLSAVNLMNADLQNCKGVKTIFRLVNLNNSNLSFAVFKDSDFEDAIMTNLWASDARFDSSNFKNANLSNSNLRKLSVVGSNLESSNFENSKLRSAVFRGANLVNVKFEDCYLEYADFSFANLNNTSFINANLANSNFKDAKGLTYEQLIEAKSIYNAGGINKEIINQISKDKPCLLNKPHSTGQCD